MTKKTTIYWHALGWLLLLAPFFFLTYGQVNQFTAARGDIGSFVYGWEKHIPFIPLTIIPYWSLNLLYGLSLFICTTLNEQRRLVCKLVLASIIACIGFLLFPLQHTFIRPETIGISGWLFSQLEQFDLPYNQSPSLHIILCWILWHHFHRHLIGKWQWLNNCWFLLIAISVLTTWQHHFIDVISGLLVGMVIDWVIPEQGKWRWNIAVNNRRKVIAIRYLCGAFVCLAGSVWLLFLFWPALALFFVALAYGVFDVSALQKDRLGRLSPAIWWLLLPWRICMKLSMYYYTRRLPAVTQLLDGLFFGIYPRTTISQQSVLDLTSEFPRSRATQKLAYYCVPMLDLVAPSELILKQAVEKLEELRITDGTVLVHCSLGLSRSALVVTAWLLQHYPTLTVTEAIEQVRNARQQIIFTPEHLDLLERWKKNITT
ncbi:phosphatase PAP2/dual specificity phosphatase family protein [Orbaceae bacterium ESL0721]|nr:phosphatase PAP2/dual specificity phosphatase family protein [Orbaceae bacterium ESL0721]